MPSKSGGVNQHQRVFKDIETLKREERQRRRLLRLEQVRQQSKDVANLVRQKVQSERGKQHGLVQERVDARTQQWQVRKLKELHKEYESTLKNVGKGHVDASRLPDEEELRKQESERILADAQRRGQEALQRMREEEEARRKADEDRRQQFHNVRAVEEARSAAVVSLPRPESTVGIKVIPPKAPVIVSVPPAKAASKTGAGNTNPEWPRRTWQQQNLPLGISADFHNCQQGDSERVEPDNLGKGDGVSKHLTSVSISSHGDASKGLASVTVEKCLVEPTRKFNQPASTRYSEASSSKTDVKLYDYSSCYQSQYDKVSGVVEKVQGIGEVNAKMAADREISSESSRSKQNENAARREQERSRKALERVQVQRDYKDLMGSLSVLAKQNAAMCSHGNILDHPVSQSQREKQLNLAVENLFQDADRTLSDSAADSNSADTQDDSLVISRLEHTPASVPRLNLGRWQPLETTPASPAESIIVVQPPSMSSIPVSFREENMERDAALRSLVQRINEERHSLLMSSQQGRVSDKEREKDIRHLEERVKQQRLLLRRQRSEVKRLEASIVSPDKRTNQSEDRPDGTSSLSSSCTHESIVIEPSHSDKSQDTSSSPLNELYNKPCTEKNKSRRSKERGKSLFGSPTKDSVMYSMDVSLSSVIMDQNENSSCGSKSVSLHGVKVLVKVCGTDDDSSESKSASQISGKDRGVKVIELHSDDDDEINAQKKTIHVEKNRGGTEKTTAKVHKKTDVPKERVPKFRREKNVKVSDMGNGLHNRPEVKTKSEPTKTKETSLKSDRHSKTKPDHPLKESRKDEKKKSKRKSTEDEQLEQPASTSTSYLSPPDRVLSSLTEDIKSLIALAQRNVQPQSGNKIGECDQNLPLFSYINRLLAMSRESIDRMNVSCSEVSTPPSTIFKSHSSDNGADFNITDIGLAVPAQEQVTIASIVSQDEGDQPTDLHLDASHVCDQANVSQIGADQILSQSISDNQEALNDMTRQCHEKISSLTRMIEEVRRQAAVNSSSPHESDQSSLSHNQSKTPVPLDSTAYMSPPPQVLEWADFALSPLSARERENRMALDPYNAAVMQLLADVRSQMSSKATDLSEPGSVLLHSSPVAEENSARLTGLSEPSHSRSKPPVAFWRNIERCNVTSPTEPHELSTILELGTTLPESVGSQGTAPMSPIHTLSPLSTPGTPPDVIAELMRRKLLTSPFAWAKKEDKQFLSSDSSLSLKNSHDSDLSSGKIGTSQSDISASKETNSLSIQSQTSSSNGSRDWKTNILMSPVDLFSSADEVEGDFRRMGIGWVGAMLRKTKEAGALSSTSSSDCSPTKTDNPDLKISSSVSEEEPIVSSSLTAVLRRERSHSTPIKGPADLASSSSSRLV